jgi:type VI secretion system protein ImpL
MFALLRRFLPIILGLLLLALVIWLLGPYFEFADYRPLESGLARLILIAVVVGIWAGAKLYKQMRANRASDQLAAAVVKQAEAEPRPSADVVQLRERFEEAVGALKQKRRSGHTLYELPWYVIIGAPGSGKTTALVNSGLHFPLEQRSGRGGLRGVGGTRNCDWWFTDEAVLLDTAGRYTTQDSDAAADSAGWSEFLTLLRKYRKRRPVNGVILTISAQDLMTQGATEGHVEAARRRLIELNKQLHIQLPVYLMVTKCDLVSGFTEYFEDLDQDGRSQVWGATFPYEQTLKGEAPQAFPAEFDALMTRLNERVFARVEDDRDVRRRTKAFGFPQQMASLRDGLAQFVTEVFSSTRFDQPILLRGVYFTSGTQEGTPIDRLLGAIGRRFAVAPDAVMQPAGRGKAYFIERLLKEVLFAESGLAGVNRRFEFQMAAAQMGVYIAMIAIAVLGVIAWTVSYNRNRNYIEQVGAEAAKFQQVPPTPTEAALDAALPRLDAVRTVANTANQYNDATPWSMRWGLYRGGSLGTAANDAYVRELSGALLPRVEALLRQRLLDFAAEPANLYDYLKAYLMLGDPRRFDEEYVAAIVKAEWAAAYAATPPTAMALSQHFQMLLDDEDDLPSIPLDQALIKEAQSTIRQASKPTIIYSVIKYEYSNDGRVARLDETAGIGSRVLRRKSGKSLSEPIPALYTKPVFEEVTGKNIAMLVAQYATDYWVWGDSAPAAADLQLANQVIDVYEKDYIAQWEAVLADFDPSFQGGQTAEALAILSGPTSPLRAIYKLADQHTYFPKPADVKPAPGVIGSVTDRVGKAIGSTLNKAGVVSVTPGAQITMHFARLHALVAGEAGQSELDRTLQKLGELQKKFGSQEVGGAAPTDPATIKAGTELVQSIKQDAAGLPDSVGELVTDIADRAAVAIRSDIRGELDGLYQQEILGACTEIVNGKYPFAKTSATDAQPEDFNRLFGPGMLLDGFFKQRVAPLVNTATRPWTWRPDASGVPVGGSVDMLRRFELAQAIRDRYFPMGSLKFDFRVLSFTVDAGTTRFILDIDGQKFNYQFGPDPNAAATWPGPTPGTASVTWEERGGASAHITYTGRWAWQRLIEAAEVQTETDVRYVLTWRRGTHTASVRIEAVSVRNPFGKTDVQQFRCG